MSDVKISITLDAAQLKRELGLTQSEIAKLENKEIALKTGKAQSSIASLRDAVAMWGLAIDGVKKVWNTLVSAISTVTKPAAEIEQLRLRLNSLYMDAERGAEAFETFRQIASRTPASLEEVVKAGATLKAFGLEAEATIDSVTDLAAYMGMDVVEAASSVGRAFAGGVGAADMLRERGVLALIKSFTGVEDLTNLTLPEFRQALLDTLSDPASGIAGTAETMAKSYIGALSNMQDALTRLAAAIGVIFTPLLSNVFRVVTRLVDGILGVGTALEEEKKAIIAQRVEFERLVITYTRLRNTQERTEKQNIQYRKTIDELMEKYPNYLENTDLEADSWDKVTRAINGSREALQNLINAKLQQAVFDEMNDQIMDVGLKITSTQTDLDLLQAELDAGVKSATKTVSTAPDPMSGSPNPGTAVVLSKYGLEKLKLEKEIKALEVERQALQDLMDKRLSVAKDFFPVPPRDEQTDGGSGSGSGIGTATAAKAELSETAKAYAALLENLRKYHSDAALANFTGYQKDLAVLSQKFEEEQRVILAAQAAQEISETEANSRLMEVRAKYDQEAGAVQKKAQDELLALSQKRIDKSVQDEAAYYEMMKFADSSYYDWKVAQIKAEVEAMAIGDAAKVELIKQYVAELDALKAENDAVTPEKKGSWFFSGLLGFDPDSDEDTAKIQAIQDTYRNIVSQASSMTAGLLRLSQQRRDQEIADLEAKAAKEGMTNDQLLKQKEAITKKYQAEERKLKNIQKAMSIGQAIINTAEGATKALAMGPIIGPIMAAFITALGLAQVGIIKAQKFATGGLFKGKGGERDDQNLAYISDGEYIVNAAATKRFQPILDAINFGKSVTAIPKLAYADGGMVSGTGGIESLMRQLITKVEILNLNLVKKELRVTNIVKPGLSGDMVRTLDGARNRMEERGYDPSLSQ